MIKDSDLIRKFLDWGKSLSSQSPAIMAFNDFRQERRYNWQQIERERCLTVFSQELQRIGFINNAAFELADRLIGSLFLYQPDELSDENLQAIIEKTNSHWKRAENPIPAKDYWERFFNENPQLRPKHIHYYDTNPSAAVYEFLQRNQIGKSDTSGTEGKLLGFDDHHISETEDDPRANMGYEELVQSANQIITDHYSKK